MKIGAICHYTTKKESNFENMENPSDFSMENANDGINSTNDGVLTEDFQSVPVRHAGEISDGSPLNAHFPHACIFRPLMARRPNLLA